ncbi:VOC family protein [Gilvimarinus agarilyticus]|uniref:VOC family protein n=1 Tax=Gilvimarinus agarilyticus TaxID=679259 RepID=UPI0005A24B22|nr:VOC family protein [Gilvimarinus agarilyticus]
MAQAMVPMLMFEGDADEAIGFYVSLFEDSGVLSMEYYGADEPGPEGTVKKASFIVAGQALMAMDSPIKHEFSFTPALSLFVTCDNAEQLRAAYGQLLDGGEARMPVDDYGFSELFAWVDDRYGVSWQLNVE